MIFGSEENSLFPLFVQLELGSWSGLVMWFFLYFLLLVVLSFCWQRFFLCSRYLNFMTVWSAFSSSLVLPRNPSILCGGEWRVETSSIFLWNSFYRSPKFSLQMPELDCTIFHWHELKYLSVHSLFSFCCDNKFLKHNSTNCSFGNNKRGKIHPRISLV